MAAVVTWCLACFVAALEAMRKAHEMELEKERGKFQKLLSEMGKSSDRESLQKQHE